MIERRQLLVSHCSCTTAIICFVLAFLLILQAVNYDFKRKIRPDFMKYHNTKQFYKPNSTKSNGFNPSNILLAINFNNPFYDNIPLLLEFYKPAFDNIVFCGPIKAKSIDVIIVEHPENQFGYFSYQCLAKAIIAKPTFDGYLYINDDMIVNWWVLSQYDLSKVWIGKKIIHEAGAEMGKPPPQNWHWWTSIEALKRCELTFRVIETEANNNRVWTFPETTTDISPQLLIQRLVENSGGKRKCLRAWSDFFYIPKNNALLFAKLSDLFYNNKVFLEVAVSTIMFMLDKKNNLLDADGLYLPDIFGDIDFTSGEHFWQKYSLELSFSHPFKLGGSSINMNVFKNILIPVSRKYAIMQRSNIEI